MDDSERCLTRRCGHSSPVLGTPVWPTVSLFSWQEHLTLTHLETSLSSTTIRVTINRTRWLDMRRWRASREKHSTDMACQLRRLVPGTPTPSERGNSLVAMRSEGGRATVIRASSPRHIPYNTGSL